MKARLVNIVGTIQSHRSTNLANIDRKIQLFDKKIKYCDKKLKKFTVTHHPIRYKVFTQTRKIFSNTQQSLKSLRNKIKQLYAKLNNLANKASKIQSHIEDMKSSRKDLLKKRIRIKKSIDQLKDQIEKCDTEIFGVKLGAKIEKRKKLTPEEWSTINKFRKRKEQLQQRIDRLRDIENKIDIIDKHYIEQIDNSRNNLKNIRAEMFKIMKDIRSTNHDANCICKQVALKLQGLRKLAA